MERGGLMRGDGVATDKGRAHAAKALLDEARWQVVRGDQAYAAAAQRYDGLTEMSTVLTPDQVREIDARLPAPQVMLP